MPQNLCRYWPRSGIISLLVPIISLHKECRNKQAMYFRKEKLVLIILRLVATQNDRIQQEFVPFQTILNNESWHLRCIIYRFQWKEVNSVGEGGK